MVVGGSLRRPDVRTPAASARTPERPDTKKPPPAGADGGLPVCSAP
ncbi:hypothetical protein STRTUCAR8_05319 [Streptomyces turgidiscabies Car8]|uniref:Uncharacterized protein n=1 Tax=Streptomyces turgidiscabies (strain Car8) TaxID=698760 RepID=L7F777_STRT8|nr:hypothetical protein STRTUCAR8_05319 [Streptomyces turgidiscabies Car8]